MKGSTDTPGPLDSVAAARKARKPNVVRRLYDWTLHWAETPYGPWALFLLAVAEASFFPIPPDVLLIALALGASRKSLRYAGICTAGSVLGGVGGWIIGMFLFEAVGRPLIDLYGAWDTYGWVREVFQERGFLWIFMAALTPIPYKVFTIAAGACQINLGVLLLASVIGRGLRFYAQGLLLRFFGRPVKRFIDRYFNLLTIAFIVLLVLGFVFVQILWKGEDAHSPEPDRNAPAGRVEERGPPPDGRPPGASPGTPRDAAGQ